MIDMVRDDPATSVHEMITLSLQLACTSTVASAIAMQVFENLHRPNAQFDELMRSQIQEALQLSELADYHVVPLMEGGVDSSCYLVRSKT